MNVSASTFRPKKDHPRLRRWLQVLIADHGLSVSALVDEIGRQPGPGGGSRYRPISRSTLERFLKDDSYGGRASTYDALSGVWAYLASKADYLRYLPDILSYEADFATRFASPDALLFHALERFFSDDTGNFKHRNSLVSMRKRLPGRYVMYRLDMEPATRKAKPSHLVRASLIEISASEHGIFIAEMQDLPKTSTYPGHSQTNQGVMATYGEFMIAIFRTVARVSFKCMVVEDLVPHFTESPVEAFWGKLFVASDLALFPSARMICKRIEKTGYPHGLYRYEDVDGDVISYLTSPTFGDHPVIP